MLVFRVRDSRAVANFSLFVDVTNVFDEPPKITMRTPLTIIEELPIGTVVGKLFDITDADVGDVFTCALSGSWT